MAWFNKTSGASPLSQEAGLDDAMLEGIAGGVASQPTTTAASPTSANDKIAGFDTSHIDLSAQAIASGAAEAAVAGVVASGQGTAAGAMHLLEAAAVQTHQDVAATLTSFAGQVATAPGHSGDAAAVGTEIGSLIASKTITATSAVHAVDAAVSGHGVTTDQAVSLLHGLSTNADAATQKLAVGEVSSLKDQQQFIGIAHGHSTSDGKQVIDDPRQFDQVGLVDEYLQTLIAPKVHVNGQGSYGGGTDLGSTISGVVDVLNNLDGGLSSVGAALQGFSGGGGGSSSSYSSPSTTTVYATTEDYVNAGSGVAYMVQTHQITAVAAFQGIEAGLKDNANSDQAISLLIGVAQGGNGNVSLQAGVGNELASLLQHPSGYQPNAGQVISALDAAVSSGQLAASGAVSVLAGLAANGTADVHALAVGEIAAIASHSGAAQTMAAIDSVVSSYAITGHDAVSLISEVAAKGDATAQLAAGAEINTLIGNGHISATQAIGDIDHAATSGAISGAQAVSLLAGVAANGSAAVQSTVASEIVSLVSSHHVSADDAVAAVAGVAAQGTPAMQAAEGGQIAALIGAHQISAPQAIQDIEHAMSTKALQPDQGVAMLAGMAGSGNADAYKAAVNEVSTLIANHTVDAGHAMATIAGAIPVDQAVAVLASCSVTGNAAAQSAAYGEIGTLVASHAITATQAMNDIAGEVASGIMSPAQAVSALLGTAEANGTDLQGAAGGALAALIANPANGLHAADLISQLHNQAFAKGVNNPLTPQKELAVMAGLAANGNADTHSRAMTEVMGVLNNNFAFDSMATIGAALVPDQAVAVLANVASLGTAAQQAAAGQEVAVLIASHSITASAAMADIDAAVSAGLPPQSVLSMLLATAQGGTTDLQGAVGAELAALAARPGGQLTTDTVINAINSDVAAATTSTSQHPATTILSHDQALAVLSGLAAHTSGDQNTKVVSDMLVQLGSAPAQHSMDAIGNSLPGDQAVSVLASLAGAGSTAVLSAAAAEMTALIGNGHVATDVAMTRIDQAVSAHALTGDQAVTLLADVAGSSAKSVQIAAGAEIGALIGSGRVTAAVAIQDIDQAVTSNALNADGAVALLAGVAAGGATGAAASEITALVKNHGVSVDQVVTDLGRVWNGGSAQAGLQGGTCSLVTQMISGHLVTASQALTDFGNAVAAVNPAQATTLLAGMAVSGNTDVQIAAIGELTALLHSNAMTPAQLTNAVDSLVTSHALTQSQGIAVLGDTVAQSLVKGDIALAVSLNSGVLNQLAHDWSPTAAGVTQLSQTLGGSIMQAAGTEIATMITSGALTVAQAQSALSNAMGLSAGGHGALDGAQMTALLGGAAASGNPAVAGMVGQALAASLQLGGASPITAAQTIPVLAAVGNNPAAEAALGAAMCAQGLSAATIQQIDRAVSANQLTGAQAVAFLGGAAGSASVSALSGSAGSLAAIHTEIAALITGGRVSAADAISTLAGAGVGTSAAVQAGTIGQIAALITGHQVTADQVAATLSGLAATGNAAVQATVSGEIASLLHSSAMTPAQFTNAVDSLVKSHALTQSQGIAVLGDTVVQSLVMGDSALATFLNSGSVSQLTRDLSPTAAGVTQVNASIMQAAGAEIATMITSGALTVAQAQSALSSAMGASTGNAVLNATQMTALLGGAAASGDPAVAGMVGHELAVGSQLSPDKAMTSAQTMSVLAAVGNNPAVEAALGAAMCAQGMSPATMQQIDRAVSANQITGAQAVAFLGGAAGAVSPLAGSVNAAAIHTEIAALITGGRVSAADAVSALASAGVGASAAVQAGAAGQIAALITGHQVTADQAAATLSGLAATGSAAVQATVSGEIASLLHSSAMTPAQFTNAVDSLVKSHALTQGQGIAMLGDTVAQSLVMGDSALAMSLNSGVINQLARDWSPTAAGVAQLSQTLGASIMQAAGAEIATMITSGALTVAQAQSTLSNVMGVSTGHAVLNTTQMTALLGGAAASGDPAVAGMVGHQLAVGMQLGPDNAMTSAQTMSVLAAVGNNPAVEAALGAAMCAQGMSPATMQQIDRAVSANQITGAQAVAFLGGAASAVSPLAGTLKPADVHTEIAALITGGRISAADAVSALAGAAVGASAAVQAATAAQMTLIVKNYQF